MDSLWGAFQTEQNMEQGRTLKAWLQTDVRGEGIPEAEQAKSTEMEFSYPQHLRDLSKYQYAVWFILS